MSKAFSCNGTKLWINGIELKEIRSVMIGKYVNIKANWIPADPGQQVAIKAQATSSPVVLLLALRDQDATEFFFRARKLGGEVVLLPNDVATLHVSFPAFDGPDAADDGPEVDIIKNERALQIIERVFAEERTHDWMLAELYEWSRPDEPCGIEFPVGGGFTQVHSEELSPGEAVHRLALRIRSNWIAGKYGRGTRLPVLNLFIELGQIAAELGYTEWRVTLPERIS